MPDNTTLTQSAQANPRAQAWLDLCPATDPQSRAHEQDIRITARVNKIKQFLSFVKWKIDVRHQLVMLSDSKGRYCVTCSHSSVAAHCSATCSLTRTGRGWHKKDKTWLHFARKDVELFEKLEHDVRLYGGEADQQLILEWEASARHLVKRTQDSPSRRGNLSVRTGPGGVNKEWTFESHWGKGPGIGDDIAPDESALKEIVPDEVEHAGGNQTQVEKSHDECNA